jgi:hypothetical protein
MGFVFNAWANCQQTQHKPLYCVSSKKGHVLPKTRPFVLIGLMLELVALPKLVTDLRASQHIV